MPRRVWLAILAFGVFTAVPVVKAASQGTADAGLVWLISRQASDGSFGQRYDVAATSLAKAVLSDRGLDLSSWKDPPPVEDCTIWETAVRGWALGEKDVLDYLAFRQNQDGSWGGRVDLTALAVLALLKDIRPCPGGVSFLLAWAGSRHEGAGSFALALTAMALQAANQTQQAVDLCSELEKQQWSDGSWQGDPAATSLALMCLRRCLVDSPAVIRGVSYVGDCLEEDGGLASRLVPRDLAAALCTFCLDEKIVVDRMAEFLLKKAEPGFIPRTDATIRTSAAAAEALMLFPEKKRELEAVRSWLSDLEPQDLNVQALQLLQGGLEHERRLAGLESLYALRAPGGGFGLLAGDPGNPFDTAAALAVMEAVRHEDPRRLEIVTALLGMQRPDGGWGIGSESDPWLTSQICSILCPEEEDTAAALDAALDYLLRLQTPDGSFGNVLSTAAAGIALRLHGRDPGKAASFIRSAQRTDGSWEDDEYTTATAIRFLNLFEELPNLSVQLVDLPELEQGETCRLEFTVANEGVLPVYNVAVCFWDGEKGSTRLGDDFVLLKLDAGESATVSRTYYPQRVGGIVLGVEIDPENVLTEYNEGDNLVYFRTTVRPPRPQNLRAAPSSGKILLSWDPPPAIAGLSGYELLRDGVTLSDSLPLDVCEYRDMGLTDGVEHEYALILHAGGLGSEPAVVSAASMMPAEEADLCFSSVELLPGTNLFVGQKCRIAASVTNRGLAPVQSVEIAFFDGDSTTGTIIAETEKAVNLGYTDTVQLILDWTPARECPLLELTVVIDSEQKIDESDRANNEAHLKAVIREAANLAVMPDDIVIASEYVNHPGTVYWSWMMEGRVEVRNTGSVPAGAFNIRLYGLSQEGVEAELFRTRCPGLAPGESFQVGIPWQKAFYYVFVQVDADGEVPETTEDDNLAGRTVSGVAGGIRAELHPGQVLLAPGEEKTATLRLANYLSHPVQLVITADCSGGLAAVPATPSVDLAAGGIAEVRIDLNAATEGDFKYRLKTSGQAVEAEAAGFALVRRAAVKILGTEAFPNCVEAGEEVAVRGVLFNVANWAQKCFVSMTVLDENDCCVWRSPAPLPVQIGTTVQNLPVNLGTIPTGGLLDGDYRVALEMTDEDGRTVAGSAAETGFTVGAAVVISRELSAQVVPPGNTEVDLSLGTSLRGQAEEYLEGINVAWCWRGTKAWGTNNAYRLIDGSLDIAVIVGDESSSSSLTVDLQRNVAVNLIQLYLKPKQSQDRYGYKLETSLDGLVWRTDADRSQNGYGEGWRSEALAPREIRYIRVSGYPEAAPIAELRALTGCSAIDVPPVPVLDSLLEYLIEGFGGNMAVGDIDHDGVPEIVTNDMQSRQTAAFDGQTGAAEWIKSTNIGEDFFLADIDGDGNTEIASECWGRIYDLDLNIKYTLPLTYRNDYRLGSIGDLDSDGSAEVLVDDVRAMYEYNLDGTQQFRVGLSQSSNGGYPLSLDIDGDRSNQVFLNHGHLYGILIGSNGRIIWQLPNPTPYADSPWGKVYMDCTGSCAVDLDLDERPEFATIYETSYYSGGRWYIEYRLVAIDTDGSVLWEYSPGISGGSWGYPLDPLAADLNGDGVPDIVAYMWHGHDQLTAVSGADGSLLWSRYFTAYGLEGIGAYDFDGDGTVEIAAFNSYNPASLLILDGRDGSVEASYDIASAGTSGQRNVCFADVDLDGHTELLFTTGKLGGDMYVLGDPTWAPSRSVWPSGANYHITDITGDLRIPVHEESSWILHNTYRVQGPALGEITSYAVTVEQDLSDDAALVSGGTEPEPLETQPEKLTWYYRLARTGPVSREVSCTLGLNGLEAGEVYEVAGETRVLTRWDGGSREIMLPPVTVACAHACWLAEDEVSAPEYGQASIGLHIKNNRNAAETFTLELLGLPAGWPVPEREPITLATGEERLVSLPVSVPYGAAPGTVRFVVLAESDMGTREIVSGELAVKSTGPAALALDKEIFAPGEHLTGLARLDNQSEEPFTFSYLIELTDGAGRAIASLEAGEVSASPREAWEHPLDLPPGTEAPGEYQVILEIYRDGLLYRSADAGFTVPAEKNLTASLAPDRQEYGPDEEIKLLASLANTGRNAAYDDLACTIRILSPKGEVLQDITYPGPYISPSSTKLETYGWLAGMNPAGVYTAYLTVNSHGEEIGKARCSINLREGASAQELLQGSVEVFPRVLAGPAEGRIEWSVVNHGNVSVEAQAELSLLSELDPAERLLETEPISLSPGESLSFCHNWGPPCRPDVYRAILRILKDDERETLAMGGYTALPYDDVPPATLITLSGEKWSDGWFKTEVTVTLAAEDNEGGSGVAAVHYRLGPDGPEQTYDSPFTISEDGRYEIYFYAEDTAGNVERTQVAEFDLRRPWTPYRTMLCRAWENSGRTEIESVLGDGPVSVRGDCELGYLGTTAESIKQRGKVEIGTLETGLPPMSFPVPDWAALDALTDAHGEKRIAGNVSLENASFGGDLSLAGRVHVTGLLVVEGDLSIAGNVVLDGAGVFCTGRVSISGNAAINGLIYAGGGITMSGDPEIAGAVISDGPASVSGHAVADAAAAEEFAVWLRPPECDE